MLLELMCEKLPKHDDNEYTNENELNRTCFMIAGRAIKLRVAEVKTISMENGNKNNPNPPFTFFPPFHSQSKDGKAEMSLEQEFLRNDRCLYGHGLVQGLEHNFSDSLYASLGSSLGSKVFQLMRLLARD